MNSGKLLKFALLSGCLAFMLCGCANSDEEDIIIITHKTEEGTYYNEKFFDNTEINIFENEGARNLYIRMISELEIVEIGEETFKEVKGEELKKLDFSHCSIAVLNGVGARIYERLSEEDTQKFVALLTKEQLSAEENYNDWHPVAGGGPFQFQITLNNGERLYVGIMYSEDDRSCIVINGEWAYECEEETAKSIIKFTDDAMQRFDDSVKAALFAIKRYNE